MTIDTTIEISGIPIRVVPGRSRNGGIRINRISGEVTLSLPIGAGVDKAHELIEPRIDWIRKHRTPILQAGKRAEPLMPERYESGEYVTLFGKVYNLEVNTEGHGRATVQEYGGTLQIRYAPQIRRVSPRNILLRWMFEAFLRFIHQRSEYWEQRLGVCCRDIKLRKMTSRWGSCNYKTGTITYNTNLIFYPKESIEYIIVHELAHLIEPNHSPNFHRIVEQHLPDWRLRDRALSGGYPLPTD